MYLLDFLSIMSDDFIIFLIFFVQMLMEKTLMREGKKIINILRFQLGHQQVASSFSQFHRESICKELVTFSQNSFNTP